MRRAILSFAFLIIVAIILSPGIKADEGFRLEPVEGARSYIYQVSAKKWTGGVRYRISGFLVHPLPVHDLNLSNTPTGRIAISEDSCHSTPAGGGDIRTSCEFGEVDILGALSDAGISNLAWGDPFYVSPIFEMSDRNGSFVGSGTDIISYNDFIRAPIDAYGFPWSAKTQQDVKSFYNHHTNFVMSGELHVVTVEEGEYWHPETSMGNELKPTYEVLPPPGSSGRTAAGKWKPGHSTTVNLDREIDVSGRKFEIVSSYVMDTMGRFNRYGTVTSGSGVYSRPLNVWAGDTYLVAEYREIFDDDDSNAPAPLPSPNPTPTPNAGSGGPQAPSVAESIVSSPATMDPTLTGVIGADSRGSERFNVAQGIPTGETLYTNVRGKDYLYEYKFDRMTGKAVWQVDVSKTYTLSWVTSEVVGWEPCTPTELG